MSREMGKAEKAAVFFKEMMITKKDKKAFAEAAVKDTSITVGNLNHESNHETIWLDYEPEPETQHWLVWICSTLRKRLCTDFWLAIYFFFIYIVFVSAVYWAFSGKYSDGTFNANLL